MSETDPCLETSKRSELIGPFIQGKATLPTIEDLIKIGSGRQRLTPIEYYQASDLIQQNRCLGYEIGLMPLEIDVAGEYFPRFVGTGKMVSEVLAELSEEIFLQKGLNEKDLSTLLTRFRRTIRKVTTLPPTVEPLIDAPLPRPESQHLDPLPPPQGQDEWIARQKSKIKGHKDTQIFKDTNWIIRNTRRLKRQSVEAEKQPDEDEETMLFWFP